MAQLDKQDWINQSGKSHDFVTSLVKVNKYVTYTQFVQIRQVGIWKMLPVWDNVTRQELNKLDKNVL